MNTIRETIESFVYPHIGYLTAKAVGGTDKADI